MNKKEMCDNSQTQVEKKEKINKYTLSPENIIILDENSEIRKRDISIEWLQGLLEEGIEWPCEIQGSGHSDYNKKKFKIWYPSGDIFLSTVITIHELGHLRQGEINERFASKFSGAPVPKFEPQDLPYEMEMDAYNRGLERAEKICSDELKLIENKFQTYKKQEKFKGYETFYDFYKKVANIITTIGEQNANQKDLSWRERGQFVGKLIKEHSEIKDFFINQKNWRTGEMVDQEEMEIFIKKMAEGIAEERY